jgi:signal peptidase I
MIIKEKYKAEFSTCSGPSMYPTLRNGDGLKLEKYKNRKDIQKGDIIVYPHPEKNFDVVHRIINFAGTNIITRGDNNNKIDPYFVTYEDIIGKVISARRKAKTIHLKNGPHGYLIHKLMLFRRFTVRNFFFPLRVLSSATAKLQIFNFLDPLIKTRKIIIKSNNSEKTLLVYKNSVIGKKMSEENDWKIKFPYKFFINKRKLQ